MPYARRVDKCGVRDGDDFRDHRFAWELEQGWSPQADAAMRMRCEISKRPVCAECGSSAGRHLSVCSHRSVQAR
jgi:hypothetical protein